jgi:hypothetical protein
MELKSQFAGVRIWEWFKGEFWVRPRVEDSIDEDNEISAADTPASTYVSSSAVSFLTTVSNDSRRVDSSETFSTTSRSRPPPPKTYFSFFALWRSSRILYCL